jgi:hypothetical protein
MRIDSSGNLLVGKTSTSSNTVGTGVFPSGLATFCRDGAEVVYVNRKTSDGELIRLAKNGTTVGSIGVTAGGVDTYIGKGTTGLRFYDGSNTDGGTGIIVPWNTSTNAARDAQMNLGSSSERYRNLYLSGGVYLGGTGSANKLDDYEEGTHQVTMTGSTSGTATLNSSLDTITFRKIGSVVHVQGRIRVSSVNGASGRVKISLPFSAVSTTDDGTALLTAVVYGGNKIDNGEGTIIWEIFESQNVANLYYSDGSSVADVSFTTHVNGSTVVGISGSYITA